MMLRQEPGRSVTGDSHDQDTATGVSRLKKLLKRIDEKLASDEYGSDVVMAGKIWTGMAEILRSALTETECQSIEVASRFWRQEATDGERLHWLEKAHHQMDEFIRQNQHLTREAAINRIVAASLMTTSGLTHELAEYMEEIGERAGIDEGEMIGIFEREVPGFACA